MTDQSRRDYHAEPPVSVRLPREVRDKLAEIAARHGRTVHAEIITAVREHVEEEAA